MADNVIEIRFTGDGGGRTPSPSPPSPTGAGSPSPPTQSGSGGGGSATGAPPPPSGAGGPGGLSGVPNPAVQARIDALYQEAYREALKAQQERKQAEFEAAQKNKEIQDRIDELHRRAYADALRGQQERKRLGESGSFGELLRYYLANPAAQAPANKAQEGYDAFQKAIHEYATRNVPRSLGVLTAALEKGAAGLGLVAATLQFVARDISLAGQQAAATIRGDSESAELARRQRNQNTGSGIGSVIGGVIGGAAGFFIGQPFVGAAVGAGIGGGLGSAIGGIPVAEQDEFMKRKAAFRQRETELSAYNQPLAERLATGQMQQQRRDMAESQILSGPLAELEQKQQELDRVNQQLDILKKISEAAEQSTAVQNRIKEKQEELDKRLANVDENTKRMVRELEKNAKTPLQQLEDRGGFTMPDERGRTNRERDTFHQAEQGRLSVPLLMDR